MKLKPRNWTTVVVAALSVLLTATIARAQPSLPDVLPDIVFYGSTSVDDAGGDPAEVSVLLPSGDSVSAPIGAINGTDYDWMLAVPIREYDDAGIADEAGTARFGDTIQFHVDGALAQFAHPTTGGSATDYRIPDDGQGRFVLLDLMVRRPDDFPIGDVNLSASRDIADSLLVLRYDIGLTTGTDDFPVGPGKIYLPLCDITGDGQCNSSDALRIMQCDAFPGGPACPVDEILLLAERALPMSSANLTLSTELLGGERSGEVTIRIAARDSRGIAGALTAELHYDPALFEIAECVADPDERLDLALCGNLAGEESASDRAAGVLRLSAVAADGLGDDELALAEVTLRAVDSDALDDLLANAGEIPDELLSVTLAGAHDLDGDDLPWRVEGLLDATSAEVLENASAALGVELDARAAAEAAAAVDGIGVVEVVPIPLQQTFAGPPTEPFSAVASVFLPLVGHVEGD